MPTTQRHNQSARRRHSRTLCEALEPRQLLSATFLNAIGIGTTSNYGLQVSAITVDSSGNVYAAGSFTGTVDVDPSAGVYNLTAAHAFTYDTFLLKYTAAGSLVWAKTFTSAATLGYNNIMASEVKIDPTGNILMAGSFADTVDMDPNAGVTNITSNGGADAFISQFDSNGNLLWAKSFGGSADDSVSKIVTDKHGGYFVSGTFEGTADLDPGVGIHNATASTNWDVFLSHIDSSGNLLWSDQFTAPNDLFVANIAVDNSGSVYAAGFFSGACDFNPGPGKKILDNGWHDFGFVAKYTPSGNLAWVKQWGQGTGTYGDATFVYDMTLDSKNNVILAGSFGGSIDVNPGPAVHLLFEHQSPDAFTGYVLKLNNAGGYVWSGAFTGDSWSDAYAVTTDANNNIYVSGEFNGTNTFDITGTSPNDTLTSRGMDDAFLAKYDAAGHLAWAEQMGGTGYDHGLHLALGPANSLYLAGYYNGTAHFGPQNGGTDLTALGTADSFIAVFTQTPATPVVTLSATPTSPFAGKWCTLTISVTPGQGLPTGKVVIRDGTRVLGIAKVDDNGNAVIKVRYLKAGTYNLVASYMGDENFAGADGLLTLTVQRGT